MDWDDTLPGCSPKVSLQNFAITIGITLILNSFSGLVPSCWLCRKHQETCLFVSICRTFKKGQQSQVPTLAALPWFFPWFFESLNGDPEQPEAVSNKFPSRRAARELETLAGAKFGSDAGRKNAWSGRFAEDVQEEQIKNGGFYSLEAMNIYELWEI